MNRYFGRRLFAFIDQSTEKSNIATKYVSLTPTLRRYTNTSHKSLWLLKTEFQYDNFIKLNKTNQMHLFFKIVKFLLQSMSLCMFRTLLCPSTEQCWRTQPTQHHTVTRGCMCSGGRLLMMNTIVSETCRAT
jgi:hypothetical protein